MAGIKALRKIQLGRESTAGTAVAATTRWRGMGTLEDLHPTVFPNEDVGLLSGTDRTYVPKYEAGLAMDSVPATFEQLPHIPEAGIETATPAQDGSGSGYIYTYNLPTTQGGTIKTYTIEGGDNEQAEEMEYSFVEGFQISGAAGEAWMMSADWKGRQITKTTFTAAGSATIPTVEEILMGGTKLYIDNADGTAGTTQVSSTFLDFTLDVTTGQQAVWTADGQKYFSFIKNVQPEYLLSMTFEHNSSSVAEKDNWIAETARLIQIKGEGSTFTTAGTAYSKKTAIITLAGKWENFEKIGENDGNDVIAATFRGRYNSDADMLGQIVIVNDLSALP